MYYAEEPISNLTKTDAFPKGNESRQVGTTSLNDCDIHCFYDKKKRKDHAAASSDSRQHLMKTKLRRFMTDDLTQFMNEKKVYSEKIEAIPKEKGKYYVYYKSSLPNLALYLK